LSWKTPVPGGANALLYDGRKICSDDTEFMGPSPSGRGWRDGRKADAPGEGRKSSQIWKPSPHPLPGGEGDSSRR